MREPNYDFIVGYGGWACMSMPSGRNYHVAGNSPAGEQGIVGSLLPITSGGVTRAMSVPTADSYYLPHDNGNADGYPDAKSKIRLGFGTYSFTGDVSFELTENTVDLLSLSSDNSYGKTFMRDSIFDLQFFDGENTCTVYNCVWTSLSFSFNPNSLVMVSMSFVSNNGYCDDLIITDHDLRKGYVFDDGDLHIPYWQTGVPGATSVSLEFSRDATPVYLNNSLRVPSYIRPGAVSMSVTVNAVEQLKWADNDNFVIRVGRSRSVVIRDAVLMSHSYHMSSLNDAGEKSYQWESIPLDSSMPLFSIV